jgi:hypothetical protein
MNQIGDQVEAARLPFSFCWVNALENDISGEAGRVDSI